MNGQPTIRVAIAGLGAIGRVLARHLADGIPGLTLACAAVRDRAKAQAWLDAEGIVCPLVELQDFPAHADLAVECAPGAVIEEICRPMLAAGKRVMVLSAGALLPRPELVDLAKSSRRADHRANRRVARPRRCDGRGRGGYPFGPYGDAKAARRPRRRALPGAEPGISVEGLNGPKRVFAGTARDGAAGFPANVNVAAALSLAGIGPDRTMMEIWADPTIERNCHAIEVDSDSARFSFTIENIPSENPKTGRITALSVLAALRKLAAPLRVGT